MTELMEDIIIAITSIIVGLWIGHYWGIKSMMPIINDYKEVVNDLNKIIDRQKLRFNALIQVLIREGVISEEGVFSERKT